MAANPEANKSHVPGSGTVSVPPPPTSQETGVFFLPVPTAPPVIAAAPLAFATGEQSPTGKGGGDKGRKFPPTNGSYKLSGRTASTPGICGRFRNADSNGTAGDCMAVPSPG